MPLSIFQFPKPRTLLRFVSLRTATEFITLTLLINKVTGFYGILALFTGYELNPLQLSHYIYSLIILGLAAWLGPAIRSRPSEPLKVLALAWLYVLDTVINAAYTALFGMGWFVLLAQHFGEETGGIGKVPGEGMMDDTAGFTNPNVNATAVEVTVKPAPGLLSGQEAVVISQVGTTTGMVLESDMMTSIGLLALFSLIRVYFCLVVMSYARGVLRRSVANASAGSVGFESTTDATMASNPFQTVEGWRGKLGRVMVRFPSKRYWLGREEIMPGEESGMLSEWERATSGRFQGGRKALRVKVPSGSAEQKGVGERERRARSGTGPPPMSASSAKSERKGLPE
ncbi:uncharacterized protein RCC_11338 [Ramularia collo-cygni]|uniref:DUF1753-domain-containing protein n=1 Tax=Ramularia collo-cygni TaxID=112498 RepID=A0A2D3VQM1_9PEZI|nr:uncharacterized protein RCC_11338 [Ramularia collo-cygni]CZT25669.1 uncharacterized protein RCC_11338 [Ramularia collo-cygni]